jgi:hypothetical protein
MKTLKKHFLVAFAAGVLLTVTAGFAVSSAHAQSINQQSNIAGVACVGAQGGWTDCTLTLGQSIAPGGSVAASLDSVSARVLFCTDGSHDDDHSACGINGNAAVFACPFGCQPGQQFMLSALGGSNAVQAQSLSVEASGVYTQSSGGPAETMVAPAARPPSE